MVAEYVIRLTAPNDPLDIRLAEPWVGNWLVAYDPEAHDGLGDAVFSADIGEAYRFPTFDAAKKCWGRQSTVRPAVWVETASDGWVERENRPLTVCSIAILEVTDELIADAQIVSMDD